MLKPKKEWTVDGQIFETYSDACAHARKFAKEIFRKKLVNDLRKIFTDEPYGEATVDSAEDVAAALLNLYEMKRK